MSLESSYSKCSRLREVSSALIAVNQVCISHKGQCVALVIVEFVILLELRSAVAALVNRCLVYYLNYHVGGWIHALIPA